MTVSEYVRNKEIRLYTTAVIKGGKMYRIWEGQEILEKDFRKMFPLPNYLWMSTNNPNENNSYLWEGS